MRDSMQLSGRPKSSRIWQCPNPVPALNPSALGLSRLMLPTQTFEICAFLLGMTRRVGSLARDRLCRLLRIEDPDRHHVTPLHLPVQPSPVFAADDGGAIMDPLARACTSDARPAQSAIRLSSGRSRIGSSSLPARATC